MFSFKKSKKYSGEHAQSGKKKVKHFKPQLLSRWPLLVPGDFGSSQTNRVSNGVIPFSDARQQVNKAHMKSRYGNSSETDILRKNPIFFTYFFFALYCALYLCTVGISNCKASMSCSPILALLPPWISKKHRKEVLLLLFKVDGSYITDVVTTPQVPFRQQKCFLSAALSIKRIIPVMHLDQDTQVRWIHGLRHFISKSVSLEGNWRLEKIFLTGAQVQTPVCSLGLTVYNDFFPILFNQHIFPTTGNC